MRVESRGVILFILYSKNNCQKSDSDLVFSLIPFASDSSVMKCSGCLSAPYVQSDWSMNEMITVGCWKVEVTVKSNSVKMSTL